MAHLTKRISEIAEDRADAAKIIANLDTCIEVMRTSPEEYKVLNEKAATPDATLIYTLRTASKMLKDYQGLLEGIMHETKVHWPPTCVENND